MASVIKIKRSGTATGAPGSLKSGELAYTYTDGVNRLYFGKGDDGGGNATSIVQIGGEFYTGLLSTTAGTVTASKAVIVDGSKKVNEWLVGNLTITGSTGTISSTNTDGDINITPAGAGKIVLDGQSWPNAVGGADTYLKTDASGVLSWAAIPSGSFTIAGDTGTDTFSTGGTLTFTGTNPVQTAISDDTVTISVDDATATTKGIASFATADFTVTSGAVTISNVNLGTQTTGNYAADVGITANTGLSITGTAGEGTSYTLAGVDATDTVKGVASFSSDNFAVTSGAVTIKDGGVSNAELVNSSISINGTAISLGGSVSNLALTTGTLAQFAATTSLELLGVISDETGTGSLVFATSPTLTTPVLGAATATSITASSGNLTLAASATGSNNVVLAPTGSGTVDVSSKRITGVADPTGAQDAATKAYVDAVKTGLDVKDSVRLATTAALTVTYDNGTAGVDATLTNAGTQAVLTLDGVPAVVGYRILVKDQGTALQNGIYTVTDIGSGSTNWILTRATDFDQDPEVTGGAFTFVEAGNTQADNGYVMTANGTIDVGADAITWVQFSGAGQITAGGGLTKDGNTLAVGAGSGITVNADDIALATTVAGDGLTYTTGVLAVGGTTNRISVSADAIDIASTYAGQNTIVTVGTLTTGALGTGFTTVNVAQGGTGATTFTSNGILYGNGIDAIQVTAAGTAGYFLYSNAGTPAWTDTIDGGTY